MTTQTTHPITASGATNIKHARKQALWIWFVLVLISAVATCTAIGLVESGDMTAPSAPDDGWFIASAVMLALVVPGCILAHWAMFKHYWRDGVVAPGGYLLAYTVLWSGLTLTSIVIAVGAIMRQSLMPDMALAGPALVFLLVTWPSGWALTHRVDYRFQDDTDLLHMH